jgi:gamma-glutamylcyclotransferase (GGCT)/AIG2-like uncharacterized protein YtfP
MLAARAHSIGPARIPGLLYDLGDYPGAVPGDGTITGEIFHLLEPPSILAALDEYEGPEFARAVVTVGGFDCWIYWYVGPYPVRLIPSGDWFAR